MLFGEFGDEMEVRKHQVSLPAKAIRTARQPVWIAILASIQASSAKAVQTVRQPVRTAIAESIIFPPTQALSGQALPLSGHHASDFVFKCV